MRPPASPLAGVVIAVWSLTAIGVLPVWSGTVHLVALPPLDLVADTALLLSRAQDPAVFALGAGVSVAVRGAVLAALLGRIDLAGWWFGIRCYLVVWPAAAIPAALLHASHAVLFYALYWFGVAAAVALLGVVGALAWLPDEHRAKAAWSARFRLGTIGAYLAGLTMIGLVAAQGGWWSVLLVAVSAAWTWATIWVMVDPGRFVVTRRVAGAAFAVGALALITVAGTGPARPVSPDGLSAPRTGSLLLMSGIDSSSGSGAMLEIDPRAFGFECEQTWYFSYAGPGRGQPRNDARCAIDHGAPYEPADTMRGRDELVGHLEAFVEEMPAPVVILAHSQAAWVTWQAAADGVLPDGSVIVLVGAFPTNPVTYRVGVPSSPGRAALTPLANLPRPGGGTSAFDPDSPLGSEWLSHPDAIASTFRRPLPQGVEAVAVPSAFDLPLKPRGAQLPLAPSSCPVAVVHPNLPFADELVEVVSAILDGGPVPSCPWWREVVGRTVAGFAPAPS